MFASRKAIPEFWSFCSPYPVKQFLILVIRQPLTCIGMLRRSCFTECRAPLEAWIGANVSDCYFRQSSMLNSIGGARTRTFFKLTNWWRSDNYFAFFSEAFFVLKNASSWSRICTKTDWGECKLKSKIWSLPYTGSVREIGRFRFR